MRTIRIKAYKFEELSEEVQTKVIDKNYDINVHDEWWDGVYEDARNIGLKITGFDTDRNRHATGEFLLSANEVAQNILNEHGDMCETYKTAENFMSVWQPVFNDYMETEEGEDKLIDLETEFLNSLLEDYAMTLEKESEYLMSEEAIKETLIANEYEYTKDGKSI